MRFRNLEKQLLAIGMVTRNLPIVWEINQLQMPTQNLEYNRTPRHPLSYFSLGASTNPQKHSQQTRTRALFHRSGNCIGKQLIPDPDNLSSSEEISKLHSTVVKNIEKDVHFRAFYRPISPPADDGGMWHPRSR